MNTLDVLAVSENLPKVLDFINGRLARAGCEARVMTQIDVAAEEVFVKRHNECFIDVTQVDCDAYRYKKDDPDAIRMYRGEYMIQYDWAYFHAE